MKGLVRRERKKGREGEMGKRRREENREGGREGRGKREGGREGKRGMKGVRKEITRRVGFPKASGKEVIRIEIRRK